jgi:hypothetical protein
MLDAALTREKDKQRMAITKTSSSKFGVESEFCDQRIRIVSWLTHLNEKFEFHPETLFLSVAIFDHFRAVVKAHAKYLNCIGIACLYLAAKTVEEDCLVPDTLMLVRNSECGCSVAEVLRMERCILSKLEWDLRFSTPIDFLHLYHALLINQCPHALDGTSLTLSQHISRLTCNLQSCLLDPRLAGFTPSTLALTVISLDMEFVGWQLWLHATVTLQSYAQINGRELVWCRELVFQRLFNGKRVLRTALSTQANTSDTICPKPAKRKVSEIASDEFYDGIKRLYAEDAINSMSTDVVMKTTCAGEMLRHPSALSQRDFITRVNN